MLQLIKEEIKRGKWIYLGETISFILFFIFISLGQSHPSLQQNYAASILLLVWMIGNVLVISLYAVYDFTTIILKEQMLSKQMLLSVVLKIALFSFFFLINSFAIAPGNNLPITVTTLVATYLVVFASRKMLQSKRMLTLLGGLWLVAFFFIFGYGYGIGVGLLYAILGSVEAGEFIIGAVYLIFSVVSIRKILARIIQP